MTVYSNFTNKKKLESAPSNLRYWDNLIWFWRWTFRGIKWIIWEKKAYVTAARVPSWGEIMRCWIRWEIAPRPRAIERKSKPGLKVWSLKWNSKLAFFVTGKEQAPTTGREGGFGDEVSWPSSQFIPSVKCEEEVVKNEGGLRVRAASVG
jgi:hypothetical protein